MPNITPVCIQDDPPKYATHKNVNNFYMLAGTTEVTQQQRSVSVSLGSPPTMWRLIRWTSGTSPTVHNGPWVWPETGMPRWVALEQCLSGWHSWCDSNNNSNNNKRIRKKCFYVTTKMTMHSVLMPILLLWYHQILWHYQSLWPDFVTSPDFVHLELMGSPSYSQN